MSGDARGMEMDVRGGVGGIHANLDDMSTTAGLIDDVSAEMLGLAAALHTFLVDPDVVASAILDPIGVAKFEAAMLTALDGPDGLTTVAGSIGLRAIGLRTAVISYRTVDDVHATLTDTRRFVQGMTLPFALSILGPLGVNWWEVEERAGRDPGADLGRLLTEHPGIIDEAVGSAPGSVAMLSLFLIPRAGAFRLATGEILFPTNVTEGAALLSLLYDDGKAHVEFLRIDRDDRVMTQPPRGFGDLMGGLNYRNNKPAGQIDVRVVERTLADGSVQRSYIVDIPGTKSWNLPNQGNGQINDLGTNLHALAGHTTAYERGIAEALLQAGAKPSDPVMLVGHSQGGIVAVNAARHFTTSGEYRVTHVVTAGSPVANLRVPDSVKVLSLENEHDIVPHLDAHENPDEPNHTTVTFDRQYGEIGANHNILRSYLPPADALDQSIDPSVRDFRDSAEPFLTGDHLTSHAYRVTRVPS